MLEITHGNRDLPGPDRSGGTDRRAAYAAALLPAGHLTRVLAACFAIYAAFLAVALLALPPFIPQPRPAGAIEQLLKFYEDKPDRFVARSYAVSPAKFPERGIRIYEGTVPMPRDSFWLTVDVDAYVIRIRPVDGSDPRTNGRHYWLVQSMD